MKTDTPLDFQTTSDESRYVEYWLEAAKDPAKARAIADRFVRPLLLQTSFLVNAYWPGEDDEQSDEARLLFPLFRDAILTALYTGFKLGEDEGYKKGYGDGYDTGVESWKFTENDK